VSDESEHEVQTEEEMAAYKLAMSYIKMFVFLDQDIDDLISVDELTVAYKNFKWPMLNG